jgi:hypothetical protein
MTVEVAVFFLIQALSAACCFQIKSPDLSVNIRTLEKRNIPKNVAMALPEENIEPMLYHVVHPTFHPSTCA